MSGLRAASGGMLSWAVGHFPGIESDLLRQGGWLLASAVGAGICNYAASVFAARMLGPMEYGVVNSLTAVAYVIGVVTSIAQTAIAGHAARLQAANAAAPGASLGQWLRWLLAGGSLGALVILLSSQGIAAWLQVASPMPVIMIGLLMMPAGGLAAVSGVLQGLGRFAQLGGLQLCLGACRLLFCIALVLLGTGAAGAVASQPASAAAALALGIVLLRGMLRDSRGWAPPIAWLRAAGQASLVLVSLAILVSADVVIAKNRLSPQDAGVYSGIATLGRMGFWISAPISTMLLPKLSERHARGESTVPLLRAGLGATALLCGGLVCVFLVCPVLIVQAFLGQEYAARAHLLGAYGLATLVFALVNAWACYFLAVQDVRYSFVLMTAAAVLLSLLMAVASNAAQFVVALIMVATLSCLAGELLLHLRKARGT